MARAGGRAGGLHRRQVEWSAFDAVQRRRHAGRPMMRCRTPRASMGARTALRSRSDATAGRIFRPRSSGLPPDTVGPSDTFFIFNPTCYHFLILELPLHNSGCIAFYRIRIIFHRDHHARISLRIFESHVAGSSSRHNHRISAHCCIAISAHDAPRGICILELEGGQQLRVLFMKRVQIALPNQDSINYEAGRNTRSRHIVPIGTAANLILPR